MNRLLLLLLLLAGGLLCPAAYAQTAADTLETDTPTTPAPARAPTLRQARQLVLERRYDSAWRLLAQLDPRNADPAIAIEKTDLALRYYTATDRLTRFAFRDLKLLDLAPDSLRQLGHDSLRYRFPVRQVLERLQRRYPDNYRLSRALGDYYYTVQQCDCAEQRLGEDEVFLRTITEYQQAHSHGQGDYLSYYALGYAYQRLGQFQASIAPFERSLVLRPRNPTVHLNMAFVLLELRELEKARDQARLAQKFFPDAHRKSDAGFLLKEIEERIRQTSGKTPPPAEPPVPEVQVVADTTQATPPVEVTPPLTDANAEGKAPKEEAAEDEPAAETPAAADEPAAAEPTPPVESKPKALKPAVAKKPTTSTKSKKASSGKSTNSKKKPSQKKKPGQAVKEAVK